MGRHETLKVEVGELVLILQLEELLQLGIGQNAATVLLVLQALVANVSIDLAGNLGPGHLGTNGLSEESGQLVGDKGGLDKAGRLAVHVLATLLVGSLPGSAKLALNLALNAAELGPEGCKCGNESLKLSVRSGKQAGFGRRWSANRSCHIHV